MWLALQYLEFPGIFKDGPSEKGSWQLAGSLPSSVPSNAHFYVITPDPHIFFSSLILPVPFWPYLAGAYPQRMIVLVPANLLI